jgi:AraC-like DNA-binding protein
MTTLVSAHAALHRLKAGARTLIVTDDGSFCAIVLEGTGTVSERAATHLVRPALILVRHAPHRMSVDAGPKGLRFLTLRWTEESLSRLGALGVGVSHPRTLFGRSSVELAWRIAAEMGRPDRLTPQAIDVLSTAVALSISRFVIHGRSRVPALAMRARRLLDQRLAAPPAMAVLAESLGVTAAHLSRAFRAGSGLSPTAYVHWRRVALARNLLLDTNQPVERIALSLGYHDASHFARRFRRWTGMAPGDFRRQRRRGAARGGASIGERPGATDGAAAR